MEFDTEHRITNKEYAEAWQAYQRGRLTLAEWESVARKMWEQSMQDTLDRLARFNDA